MAVTTCRPKRPSCTKRCHASASTRSSPFYRITLAPLRPHNRVRSTSKGGSGYTVSSICGVVRWRRTVVRPFRITRLPVVRLPVRLVRVRCSACCACVGVDDALRYDRCFVGSTYRSTKRVRKVPLGPFFRTPSLPFLCARETLRNETTPPSARFRNIFFIVPWDIRPVSRGT